MLITVIILAIVIGYIFNIVFFKTSNKLYSILIDDHSKKSYKFLIRTNIIFLFIPYLLWVLYLSVFAYLGITMLKDIVKAKITIFTLCITRLWKGL